jgi:general secretion pathway protein K
MNKRRHRRDESGVALVIALVVVVLLTAMVVEFSFRTNVEASLTANRDAQFQAYLAAKSAVAEAIGLLATDLLDSTENEGAEYDSFWDATPWAAGINGKQMNDAFMRAGIDDECGKINLNALLLPPDIEQLDDREDAPPPEENQWLIETLRVFLLQRDPELEDDPIDAILDWLDYNDMDDERTSGAEAEYYEGLENPYPIKNGPMDSLEELLLIKGITPKLYFGNPKADPPILPLDHYLTVHGDPLGRINANTAEPEVVYAAVDGYAAGGGDANVDAAHAIIQRQMDQQPFMDVAELQSYFPQPRRQQRRQQRQRPRTVNQLKQNRPVQPAEDDDGEANPVTGPTSQSSWRVNSEYFRIHGDGMLDDSLVRIEAFVWRQPFQQGQNIQPNQITPTQDVTAPEPFRFLDYKIIR